MSAGTKTPAPGERSSQGRMVMDRELLEWAAKAAGIVGAWFPGYLDPHPGHFGMNISPVGHDVWDPWNDDGDALRLAVKLQLTVCNEHTSAGVAYCTNTDDKEYPSVRSGESESEVIEDDYAATRRAIVRAADEIGKATASDGEGG